MPSARALTSKTSLLFKNAHKHLPYPGKHREPADSGPMPGSSQLGKIVLFGMLLLVPASFVAEALHANSLLAFSLAGLAIMPLAAIIARSTETLSGRVGPAVGGLVNATFGNATEMIVSVMALSAGLVDVVKSSISGTIITNSLLAVGLAMVLGGLKRKELRFRPAVARLNAKSLLLALVVLLIPTGLRATSQDLASAQMEHFSTVASGLLLTYYLLTLLFSMRTHRHLFELDDDIENGEGETDENRAKTSGRFWRPFLILLAASMTLVFVSEILVANLKAAIEDRGLSESFVGVILIPIFGGAVEYIVAGHFALRNKLDLALAMAMGSSLQIAMFVAPILVIAGQLMGQPMDLRLNPFEVLAVVVAVLITNSVSTSGRANWLEGVLLLMTYGVLAAGFYFHS